MEEDFEKKVSEVINHDTGFNFGGLKQMAQVWTKAGISSLTSWMAFADELDESELREIPDYILSDTLEKELGSVVLVCVYELKRSKYLPNEANCGHAIGVVEREGAYLIDWKDFEIVGFDGNPVYSEEILAGAPEEDREGIATAFWMIVKDICEDGRMLSPDLYSARIILEYFREYPVPPDNAFLIGQLYKELCLKQSYEGELSAYYSSLKDGQERRQKGASATKLKAEEPREFCVSLFVEIAEQIGLKLILTPAEVQARELRKVALEKRPKDFVRSGKQYSEEWFLRNIIEDRKIERLKSSKS